jgi:hypothetical protein
MRKTKDQLRLEHLLTLIPEEKQTAGEFIIDEILFLKKPLRDSKKKLETGNTTDSAEVRNYDTLCKRYSALIKQLTDLLPKKPPQEELDGLTAFIQGSDKA